MIGPSETSTDPFGTLVSLDFNEPLVICCPRGTNSKTLWQKCRLMELGCYHVRPS